MQKIKWALICMVLLFLLCSCNALHGPRLPQEKDMGAYLLTYFKDDTHSLHMALSTDGYRFTSPKHGAVIQLTKKEAKTLADHWGLKLVF